MKKVMFSECDRVDERRHWILDYYLINHVVPAASLYSYNWTAPASSLNSDCYYILVGLFGKHEVYRYLSTHWKRVGCSIPVYVFKLAYSALMSSAMENAKPIINHADATIGGHEEESIKDIDTYTSVLKTTVERVHRNDKWMSIVFTNGISILMYVQSLQYTYNYGVLDKLVNGSKVYVKHTSIKWVMKDDRIYMNVTGYFAIKFV